MLSNLMDTDHQEWLPLASQNGSQGDRRYYDIFISTFLGCLNFLRCALIPFVVKTSVRKLYFLCPFPHQVSSLNKGLICDFSCCCFISFVQWLVTDLELEFLNGVFTNLWNFYCHFEKSVSFI